MSGCPSARGICRCNHLHMMQRLSHATSFSEDSKFNDLPSEGRRSCRIWPHACIRADEQEITQPHRLERRQWCIRCVCLGAFEHKNDDAEIIGQAAKPALLVTMLDFMAPAQPPAPQIVKPANGLAHTQPDKWQKPADAFIVDGIVAMACGKAVTTTAPSDLGGT